MPDKTLIKVGIVDDHKLPRMALSYLIAGSNDKNTRHRYEVTFQADNGRDMIEKLRASHPQTPHPQPSHSQAPHPQTGPLPDIILLDINMPEMNGYEAAEWLAANYPGIKMMAISMDDSAAAIVDMLRKGAKGYLMKDITEGELMKALDALVTDGSYYSAAIIDKLLYPSGVPLPGRKEESPTLNHRELEFLNMIALDLSYKEIADRMYLSPRTIDGYRDALFEKLNVKTRIGLLMYAVKKGIIDLEVTNRPFQLC